VLVIWGPNIGRRREAHLGFSYSNWDSAVWFTLSPSSRPSVRQEPAQPYAVLDPELVPSQPADMAIDWREVTAALCCLTRVATYPTSA
jgi:hypothetical protein